MISKTLNITKTCVVEQSPLCWGKKTYELGAAKYNAWQAGMHIQDVWPHMSLDDREFLISSCCGCCFDELFGDEEE